MGDGVGGLGDGVDRSHVWALYLLGDVLRTFAGDSVPGEMQGQQAAPWMWSLAAGVMLIQLAARGR